MRAWVKPLVILLSKVPGCSARDLVVEHNRPVSLRTIAVVDRDMLLMVFSPPPPPPPPKKTRGAALVKIHPKLQVRGRPITNGNTQGKLQA